VSKKLANLRSIQLLAQCHLPSRIDTVNMKNQLCQIDPDRVMFILGRPAFLWWCRDTSTLAKLMPCKVGRVLP